MRGAKKDIAVTKLLWKNGFFLDKRSFVSLGEPHLYLKGRDIGQQRDKLAPFGRTLICGLCRRPIPEYHDWHMDHKEGGTSGRCDCLHNLQPVHAECHYKKHVHVQWTPKTEVA